MVEQMRKGKKNGWRRREEGREEFISERRWGSRFNSRFSAINDWIKQSQMINFEHVLLYVRDITWSNFSWCSDHIVYQKEHDDGLLLLLYFNWSPAMILRLFNQSKSFSHWTATSEREDSHRCPWNWRIGRDGILMMRAPGKGERMSRNIQWVFFSLLIFGVELLFCLVSRLLLHAASALFITSSWSSGRSEKQSERTWVSHIHNFLWTNISPLFYQLLPCCSLLPFLPFRESES